MVNVFEITSSPLGIQRTLNLLFKKNVNSKIKFVRLASHFGEIGKAFKISKMLQKRIFCCSKFDANFRAK